MGHEDHASDQTDSVHGFLRDTQTKNQANGRSALRPRRPQKGAFTMKKSRRFLIIGLVLTLILAVGITAYAVEVKTSPRFDALMEIVHEEEMRRLEAVANAPAGTEFDFGTNFGCFFGEDGKLTEEAIALADARIAQKAAK